MARPGPKPTPLDDPVLEEKRRLRLEQRRESYYRNHEAEKEKRRRKSAERRAAGYQRYETERTYYLTAKYGFTVEDYERMLAEQDGKCAACGTTEVRNGKTRFDIDHCHETGKVRGLLCGKCNRGLGMLDDSVERIVMLLSYMLSHENLLTVKE